MSGAALFDVLSSGQAGRPVLRDAKQAWDAPSILESITSLDDLLTGCRVLAVLADNSPAWVMADLAALKSGVVHLPIPAFFSPAQVVHALNAAGADLLLTDQPALVEKLGLGFERKGEWKGLSLLSRMVRPAVLPIGTAKLSFTSGSTGSPKGVCLSAKGLLDTALALASRLADLPIERHLAVLPLSLLLENVAGIYAPLLRGTEIHLASLRTLGWQGMAGFDAAALQRVVTETRANSLILVPELAKAWSIHLDASGQPAAAELQFVAVGGARVDHGLLVRGRSLGLPIYQGYGLTECGSVVSLNRPGDDGAGVGRPLPHVAVRIDNGEVRVRTKAFLGYLGTADGPGGDEFATGDGGQFDSAGHLYLDGRLKNLLITSYGRNVSPEWVESLLLAETSIAQALVVGDGRPALAALLVATPGFEPVDLAAAVARVNRTLPDYARIGAWLRVEPFSVQNGLATGNGRPRRAAINTKFANEIASLYSEKEPSRVVL